MENKLNSTKNNEMQDSNAAVDFDALINKLPEFTPTAQPENEDAQTDQEGYKTNSFLYYFFCVFGVIFFTLFYYFQVYLSPISVVGQSMLPAINVSTTSDEDTQHIDIVYYRAKKSYTYGDIIIISNKTNQYIDDTKQEHEVDYLIKRIVALPGDKITFYLTDISENGLYYYYDIKVEHPDGTQVELNEESYIKEKMFLMKGYLYTGLLNQISQYILNDSLGLDNREFSITISKNCYFAMGDNRNNSLDSRNFGEIASADICGNVRLHVKYGENIWIAIFNKIKTYLSFNYQFIKEYL